MSSAGNASDLLSRLNRPVAILGAGVSGQGAADLARRLGGAVTFYDESGRAGARRAFEAEDASGHDLVVWSPGFRSDHRWLRTAVAAGCVCINELDFAAVFWRGPVYAITGTNGKTTLTDFFAHALRVAGLKTRSVGNVGVSFAAAAAEVIESSEPEIAVCEISSFQAESLFHLRPELLMWTNFAEDHLERHAGMDAYFRAKARLIGLTREGACFYGPSVAAFARETRVRLPEGGLVSTDELSGPDGTVFAFEPQAENFRLARAGWRFLKLPEAALESAAHTFVLGPHRLAKVGEARGVTFWNDSKATNFHAVEAALARFSKPICWIGGGKGKGGDIGGFARRIAPKVREAFVLGETAGELEAAFSDAGIACRRFNSLQEAVESAFTAAVSGDEVVFSPGFASFDMFSGYAERGRSFETIVNQIKQASIFC